MEKNKFVVLDLFYTKEEDREVFKGTLEECQHFIKKRGYSCLTLRIIPEFLHNPESNNKTI